MTTRAPFLLTLAALLLTACAMALSGPETHGTSRAALAGDATGRSFACALAARAFGGGTRLEGRVEAREALSASYELRVRGSGVSIDQSGDVSLAAGQSAVLGEASLSSALSALDARLTVTANGRTVTCPLQGS